MSRQSTGLQPARDLAERRERAAAEQMGAKQRLLDDCVARLESLTQYRQEYANSLHQSLKLDASRLRDYRAFLARLNDAIAQQQQILLRAEGDLELARRSWQEAHTQVLALDKVLETRAAEERQRVDRREQAAADELTHNRRRTPD